MSWLTNWPAPRRLPWLLLISAAVIVADRLTKTWVSAHIRLGGAIPVFDHVLRISHWTNEGAAFSLFADSASPNAVRWGLIAFTLLPRWPFSLPCCAWATASLSPPSLSRSSWAAPSATSTTASLTARSWTSSRSISSPITGPTSTWPTPRSSPAPACSSSIPCCRANAPIPDKDFTREPSTLQAILAYLRHRRHRPCERAFLQPAHATASRGMT